MSSIYVLFLFNKPERPSEQFGRRRMRCESSHRLTSSQSCCHEYAGVCIQNPYFTKPFFCCLDTSVLIIGGIQGSHSDPPLTTPSSILTHPFNGSRPRRRLPKCVLQTLLISKIFSNAFKTRHIQKFTCKIALWQQVATFGAIFSP